MYDMGVVGAVGSGSGSGGAGGRLAMTAIRANNDSIERFL
jgi:hypothetical protein